MQMWKFLLVAMMILANAGASAAATASVTCGINGYTNESEFGTGNNLPAYLNISYPTSADSGAPGLFWLGIISPDQTQGAVLTERGWETYQGGLYPFQSRHDGGLPRTITLSTPFPNNRMSTSGYVGYSVYLGHGAYTPKMRQMVVDRRTALNSAKPTMVAAGRWNAELDSDDRFIWSMIQRDMVDNGKYGEVITIPSLNCYYSRH